MQTQEQIKIAVRLYENPKYNTTYGIGLRHHAVFNGAADLKNPREKYLLDFYCFKHWEHTARTEEQIEATKIAYDRAGNDALFSWVVHYDPITKKKTPVIGYCFYDMDNGVMELVILDKKVGIREHWLLSPAPCKPVPGKKSPMLLAANCELGVW